MQKRTGTGNTEKRTVADACKAFAACANYPEEIAARNLLHETVASVCHAQGLDPYQLIKRCAAASSWCPTPFDIRAMASRMTDESRRAPAGCERCEGIGWIHSVRLVVSPLGDYEADYSGHCKCPLGDFLKAGERQLIESRQYGRS